MTFLNSKGSFFSIIFFNIDYTFYMLFPSSKFLEINHIEQKNNNYRVKLDFILTLNRFSFKIKSKI